MPSGNTEFAATSGLAPNRELVATIVAGWTGADQGLLDLHGNDRAKSEAARSAC